MANPLDMINYLFGVRIIVRDEVLYIEDRRPTFAVGASIGAVVVVIAFAAWGWWTRTIVLDWFTGVITIAPVIVALFFLIKGNYREVYVFNKRTDSFTFTRQSVLRRDVLEGSASQFRAVQVELRTSDGDDDRREYYMVALLCQGPLFGQSDTQILRESPPLLNTRATANRIASAISKFLDIPRQGVVEVL